MVSAKEREDLQERKMDELEAKWSGKVWEARAGEDRARSDEVRLSAEVRELKGKLGEKDDEIERRKRSEIE